MRIVYQIEDIEKECFEYVRKLHPLSLLKRKAVTKLEQFKKLDYHLGWKLELIRRNIDMGAEVGGKEQVEI